MQPIDLATKFKTFSDHWNPRVVAELNGQHVKLAKFQGEFDWHAHANEDELFYVVSGEFEMHFRDSVQLVTAGQMIVVPRGVEHRPVAEQEVHVMMFEPASTLNTGDGERSERTREELDRI